MSRTSPSLTTDSRIDQEGIAVILSAPSGTGKTTIIKRLMEKHPEIKFSISHTTRSPRQGERDGVDYHFTSCAEFGQMRERGEFLEWAEICGHFYGTTVTSVRRIQEQGQDIILDLDVQGAESLHKLKFPGVFVFILPPSFKELASRLNKRGSEPEDKIRQRLETGKREIQQLPLYDYIVTNRDVDETVDNILAILKAEKLRAVRYRPTSEDIEILLTRGGTA